MNELTVPPAPHWYKSSIVACSPDNVLVYGSKHDLVVIQEKTAEKPLDVKIIHGAHLKHITSVSLNRKWKDPNAFVASLGEDNIIKIWNLQTFEKKTSNKDHTEHKESVIGAVFAGDDRVVSASVTGFVIVWNINTNESKPLKDLFKSKVTLTCLSSCPHAGWLLAFGLSNGAVVVADLRRNGQVLYKLRGHYQSVVALSWCPAPINVFPQNVNNKVKNKSLEDENHSTNSTQEINIVKKKTEHPWVSLSRDKIQSEQTDSLSADLQDFLTECDQLKNKILNVEEAVQTNLNHNEVPDLEIKSKQKTATKHRQEQDEVRENFQNRPLPTHYDPSGDFFDDSVLDSSITEDKDEGSEKIIDTETKVSEESNEELDSEESKDVGTEKDEDSGILIENTTSLEQTMEEEPRSEYLLASSGKDRSIYIWRAGTDGRMQTFFYANRKGNRKDKNIGTWISVCWATPDTIFTSSATGEVLAWTIPKPKEAKKQNYIVHYEHSSLIFNIVTAPIYLTPYNWRDNFNSTIWTWGQDGKLINYDLKNDKILYSYSTVTAMVTCFSSSALDPNRLAIGFRDGSIKIWDLSLSLSNTVSMQKYQQKYTHKLSAIAWHPLKEMVIGFGTEEGRVGFMELNTKKNTVFPHYFHSQVYKVEWGPLKGNTTNLGLYVISEGKLAIYDMQKPDENPTQLELPEKLFVYNFAWKPDYTILLLNGKDGSLIVLKTDLTTLTTVYPSEKGLNSIVWHPDSFTHDIEISPRCNWFAAATNKGVVVFNCYSINENFADKLVALFEGHLKPAIALAWSPYDGNKIVSLAADGLAHVWDVTTKAILSTFVESYVSHNFAVAWSPIDADFIITGDKFLKVWSISDNPPQNDEDFIAARKRLLAKSAKSDDKVEKNKIKIDIPSKPKSTPKNCIVPTFYVSNDENIASQVAIMKKMLNSQEPQTEISCEKLLDPFKIFGSKEEISLLLSENYNQQRKEGKYKSCEMISLWRGNVGDYIQTAINENRVTPSIIGLAPMVSPKLWQDACLTYAKKLSEEANSDPLETSMYFLACHKVEEAINCLSVNLMFREALALAKQRLPENSEIIKDVAEKWALHCTNTGNFENAAYCYISVKDYENAAKVLSRRNHSEFLEFAIELAEKAGNKELSDSIKFKYNEALSGNQEEQDGSNEETEEIPTRVEACVNKMSQEETQNIESDSAVRDESEQNSGSESTNEIPLTVEAEEETKNSKSDCADQAQSVHEE